MSYDHGIPGCINLLMPNVFSHPYHLGESISNFRVVGWYFSFSNFKGHFCKQTVERRLICFCTVCQYPTKRTLGLPLHDSNKTCSNYAMTDLYYA